MYILTALVLIAFPFFAEASSGTGLSIPLSKRSVFHHTDGSIDMTKVHASRHHTIAYVSLFSSRTQLDGLLVGMLEKSSADSKVTRRTLANTTLSH
jgi:hypothetical protein